MMNFKRMVVLPEEQYLLLRTNRNDSNSMVEEIHNLQTTALPADQRVKLEGAIISKYASPSQNESSNWIMNVIEQFPKQYRNRAKQLYMHLTQALPMKPWNEKAELLNDRQEAIPFSNIIDLLSYTTSSYTTLKKPPIGFETFLELLRVANIPKHFVNEKTRDLLHTSSTNSQWISYDL